jgi:hypothetical protein
VVVDGDRQDLLGALLPDDIVVEEVLDLDRSRQSDGGAVLLPLALLGDDVVAELDALVADVDGGAGDQLADLPLPLPTEGAREIAVMVAVLPAQVVTSASHRSLRAVRPLGQPDLDQKPRRLAMKI